MLFFQILSDIEIIGHAKNVAVNIQKKVQAYIAPTFTEEGLGVLE
tara:strand:- start:36 stop:170 length:135 start_codon:yes stop_codon:yes gene_type:complete